MAVGGRVNISRTRSTVLVFSRGQEVGQGRARLDASSQEKV